MASIPAPAGAPDSAHASPLIGDRYRVLDTLGRGGMGVVYRVRDPASGRDLACKQLLVRDDGSQSQKAVSLFEREFYVLSQLAHPRVIAVYDYGVDAAGPFYTMELLDGGDLKALSPLPVAPTCALLIEVCSSLALLHARHFVHRDISPRNIRCTRDGHAKLIDFGAMVPMGPCTHVVGTPAFVAPEVISHSTLDARTDLFSLGATLYFTLTGRPAFPAQEFADLRELWSEAFVPPSQLVAGIPPALDTLCAALLRIDPAQRPRNAFEVMQRLQAIAGVAIDEPQTVAQAYLTTPALTGRDDSLRSFRQCMRRALHGEGSVLLLRCAAGLGRSRVLDACALEAKTLGAIVLRAAASTSTGAPFAIAQALAEQALRLLPQAALVAADVAAVRDVLFESSAGVPALRTFHGAAADQAAVAQALAAWFTQLCESHALLLAIDDIERADEASVALLAALALEAKDLRLVVQVTADSDTLAQPQPSLRVLAQHALVLALRALSREQTELLLASVFGRAENLALLADRVFRVSLGNPRDTMQVVQQLVTLGVLRYEHGSWTLPAELDSAALPASVAQLLVARVQALPALARRLAEAQALVGNVLTRRDYLLLAPDADPAAIDRAISTLLEQEIVQSDGENYKLSQRALSETLCALIEPEPKRQRHLALYELARNQPGIHPFSAVQHLLEAEQYERALDVLAQYAGVWDHAEVEAGMRADPARMGNTLERALELAIRFERPAREICELRRNLLGLSIRSNDDTLHARQSPVWLAQLTHDSGLDDYRALDPTLPPDARLQRALGAAAARFGATPERERVYRPDEAIRYLTVYVVMSIVESARAADVELMLTLPGLLEPFAPLSPALHALWQNAEALCELHQGRALQARTCWMQVYERLGAAPDATTPMVESIRFAVARGISNIEATLGRGAVVHAWTAKLDASHHQRIGAMFDRRLLSLSHADRDAAEHYGRQLELLTLRSGERQMFHPPWYHELPFRAAVRDLTGIKSVIDAEVPLAARYAGWLPPLRLAQAEFELARGNLTAAREAFSEAIALACRGRESEPVWTTAWADATAGLIAVHCELSEFERAVAIGERALEVCAARGFELNVVPITQRLAVAESRSNRVARAAARIDALIAWQQGLGCHGLPIAQSYVARARVAICARDAAAAAHFVALAAHEPGGEKLLAATFNSEPMIAEARRAGVELALAPTAFEVSVLGSSKVAAASPQATRWREVLRACPTPAQRHTRALELLCELTEAETGQLYLVGSDAKLTPVAASPGTTPDAHAVQFARGFFAQQIDDDDFTAGLTHATHMLSLPGAAAYIDDRGRESRLLMLTCKHNGNLVYVGLAVLVVKNKARLDLQLAAALPVIAACLLDAASSAQAVG